MRDKTGTKRGDLLIQIYAIELAYKERRLKQIIKKDKESGRVTIGHYDH